MEAGGGRPGRRHAPPALFPERRKTPIALGWQDDRLGGARVFVLPNRAAAMRTTATRRCSPRSARSRQQPLRYGSPEGLRYYFFFAPPFFARVQSASNTFASRFTSRTSRMTIPTSRRSSSSGFRRL